MRDVIAVTWCRAAAGAAEVNARLQRQSTLSTEARYQPGYSADGVVQVVEHVERIGETFITDNYPAVRSCRGRITIISVVVVIVIFVIFGLLRERQFCTQAHKIGIRNSTGKN